MKTKDDKLINPNNVNSNISHELLTPINAIIGMSSKLYEEKGIKELEIIKEKGEELLKNINKLLGINNKELFNIDELIYDIFIPFESLVKMKYQRKTEQISCFSNKEKLKELLEEVIVSYVNCSRQLELIVSKEDDFLVITFNNHKDISIESSDDFLITVNKNKSTIKFNYQKEETKEFNGNLLLVEDDEINQDISKSFLESLGFSIQIANDGLEALEIFKNNPYKFNCVIMDCQMPNMDGYECTKEIRKINKSIPIVALTANAFKENKEKCLESGFNEFLIKPINENEVIRVLKKNLPMAFDNSNEESLNSFKDNSGDKGEFLGKLFYKFLDNLVHKDLLLIEDYLNNKDYDNLRKTFHKLKSTFGTFGFEKTMGLLNEYQRKEEFFFEDYFIFRSHMKSDFVFMEKWLSDNNINNCKELFNKF